LYKQRDPLLQDNEITSKFSEAKEEIDKSINVFMSLNNRKKPPVNLVDFVMEKTTRKYVCDLIREQLIEGIYKSSYLLT